MSTNAGDGVFVGVQLGSHSVFGEGVERVLDTLQQSAGVNAVFVYSHAYQDFMRHRPSDGLADHAGRNLGTGHRWVPAHEEFYRSTYLRHPEGSDDFYAGRDIFEELAAPAEERGIAVYGRMLEGHAEYIAKNVDMWPRVLAVDVYGRKAPMPCWNNPAYRNFMVETVADVVGSHNLAGFKYGAERSGPLSQLVLQRRAPGCFCEYCQFRGANRGISVDRAMQGFRAVHELIERCAEGRRPIEGAFVAFLSLLLRFPEVLAWERLWFEAMESGAQEIYGTVKSMQPEAHVGWHVWHAVTFDPIYQAGVDYGRMATYSDWVKPVVYHDIAGARIQILCDQLAKTVLSDMTPSAVRTLLFEVLGYDTGKEAAYADLPTHGMSADYVWRETRRCVQGVGEGTPVYSGVGFDVPTNGNPIRSTPDCVFRATYRAFEAGAAGLLISREYDEMRIENLRAVGDAIVQAGRDGVIASTVHG